MATENGGRPKKPGAFHPKRYRHWLEINKVFFETVAATCLAGAAIVVGVVQANIASHQRDLSERQNALVDKQNSLVDLQTRIAEAQAMPTFDIRIAQQINQTTGSADENFLTIDNSGGPVHEFDARAIYIVEISAALPIPPMKPTILQLFVDDYYAANIVSATKQGRLVTMIGHNNNLGFVKFSAALREEAKSRGWMYANAEERTYLHLFYKDILNRVHDEYYLVEPVFGGRSVTHRDGVAAFEVVEKLRRVHLSELTADMVVPHIDERLKTRN